VSFVSIKANVNLCSIMSDGRLTDSIVSTGTKVLRIIFLKLSKSIRIRMKTGLPSSKNSMMIENYPNITLQLTFGGLNPNNYWADKPCLSSNSSKYIIQKNGSRQCLTL